MEGRTHLASGLLLWAAGFGPSAVVGALLPDVDCANAALGSRAVEAAYGHRGLFHSLSYLAIIGGTAVIAGLDGLAAGYAAHLVLDSLTVSGLRPFAPFSSRRVNGPLRTGGFFDTLLAAIFMAAAAASAI